MIHSFTCREALRAAIFLAANGGGSPLTVREIATSLSSRRQTLAKILYGLKRHGLLRSTKGPGGGYVLARAANTIHLLDIVEAVDGSFDLNKNCVLGLGECNSNYPCDLHRAWTRFREAYCAGVSGTTLEEAARNWQSGRTT